MSKAQLLSAALLLLFAASGAQADASPASRYGLGEAEFNAAHAKMLESGRRLVDISVAEVDGKPVIAAIWRRPNPESTSATPERVRQLRSLVFLKQTREELAVLGQRLGKEGSQLEAIDAYESGGKTVFAASFCPPKEEPAAIVGVFLESHEAGDMRQKAQQQGHDLVRMEMYEDVDGPRFLPSFIRRPKADMEMIDADGTLQFGAEQMKVQASGKLPLSISAYLQESGYPGYTAMFERGSKRGLLLEKSLAEFRAEIEPVLANGGFIVDIDSVVVHGKLSYSAVVQLLR